jgi:acyl phosphate:glycerol-3-phosphate acyltransferase
MVIVFALVIVAYLVGSVPFGLVAGRLKGVDLRQHGSGNVGATNVVRVLGKPIGIGVFALDFLKGLVPTVWFPSVAAVRGVDASPDGLALGFGAAAVIGHVFSCWLRFKGGKGVATSAGLCCGLHAPATLVAFAIWYLVLKLTKYVSVASLVSAVAFPLAFIAFVGAETAFGERRVVTIAAGVLAIVIVYTHRANIGRLLRGEENRVGAARPQVAGDPEKERT